MKAKVDIFLLHADVADRILERLGRSIIQRDDVDLHDVLMAWRELFDDQLTQCERKFLHSPVVRFQEFEKVFGRLERHAQAC